jgi:hypothetical protein
MALHPVAARCTEWLGFTPAGVRSWDSVSRRSCSNLLRFVAARRGISDERGTRAAIGVHNFAQFCTVLTGPAVGLMARIECLHPSVEWCAPVTRGRGWLGRERCCRTNFEGEIPVLSGDHPVRAARHGCATRGGRARASRRIATGKPESLPVPPGARGEQAEFISGIGPRSPSRQNENRRANVVFAPADSLRCCGCSAYRAQMPGHDQTSGIAGLRL